MKSWKVILTFTRPLLGDIVAGADVVHPMSGHGIDDVALIHLGARSVTGVDYSPTAASEAQRRADELGVDCKYVTATLPASGLTDNSADLIYTGKGALIWVDDLEAWLTEMRRLLRPGGHLFIYEVHALTPLWSWARDKVEVRGDRGYFARSRVNDSFPAGGAVEYQRTFAETIMAITGADFEILHLEEHPNRSGGPTAWTQPPGTARSRMRSACSHGTEPERRRNRSILFCRPAP